MVRFNILLTIMALSISFQFLAAFMALRLIRISGVIAAWSLVASALLVMGIRRAVVLLQILDGYNQGNLTVELLGLLISLLMLIGICLIKPLFDKLARCQQNLIDNQQQLKKINHTLEERVKQEVADNLEKDRMMMRQAREAAMGEMIGNVAHQWKQPLNSLALNIQEMQYSYQIQTLTAEEMDRGTARSMELIRFMSQTVDDFKNFFSPQKSVRPFSLVSEVERALSFVSSSYRDKSLTLEKHIKEDSQLNGVSNEFVQILMNILQNAVEAFEDKKVLAPHVTVTVTREQGRALVAIRDNAGGIAPDMFERIFEAYATSKNNGSGIGLYMSRMIIEKSFGGTITAANVEGGAEFRILI